MTFRPFPTRAAGASLAMAGLAFIASCKSLPRNDSAALSEDAPKAIHYNPDDVGAVKVLNYRGFDPKAMSPEAAEGLSMIFGGKGFNFGLPLEVVKAGFFKQGVKDDDLAAFHWQAFGNVPPPPNFRPLGFTSNLGQGFFETGGKTFINDSCFTCHAGVMNGYVFPGLPNTNHDAAGLYGGATALRDAWRSWVGKGAKYVALNAKQRAATDAFLWHFDQILEPTFRFGQHRGGNMGAYGVWKLLVALKDPAKSGFDLDKGGRTAIDRRMFTDDLRLPPIEPNPWWVRKFRRTSYWYQDGYSTDQRRRAARHFAVNFTVPQPDMNPNFVKHVDEIEKILAFVDQTQAPELPRDMVVDAKVAAVGRALFHGELALGRYDGNNADQVLGQKDGGSKLPCARCHGTYTPTQDGGWTVDFTRHGEDIPLERVGTDDAYSKTLIRFQPIVDHIDGLQGFLKTKYNSDDYPEASVPTEDQEGAYSPPPLVGLWASAPYFHNGSVPTLWAVLKSSDRPAIWRKSLNPLSYDFPRVGLDVAVITPAEAQAAEAKAKGKAFDHPDAVAFRRIYDTKRYGMGNGGHTYGDAMSDAERQAVIEFLKSVTGPKVKPAPRQASAAN